MSDEKKCWSESCVEEGLEMDPNSPFRDTRYKRNGIDPDSPFRRNSMYERFESSSEEEDLPAPGMGLEAVKPDGYDGHAKFNFTEEKRRKFVRETLDRY